MNCSTHHGGALDLERRLIRVLHEHSFEDDATRILRAIRYASRLNFQLESRTRVLLERGLPYLSTISADRVRHELERIFRELRSGAIIEMAGRLGMSSRNSFGAAGRSDNPSRD